MEIPEPPFERLPKHFLLQGSPALESLSFSEFENFLDEKEYKMLKVKICNVKYDDFYRFEAENIIKAREIVARENSARGWEDDDCYSEMEGDEERDEHL